MSAFKSEGYTVFRDGDPGVPDIAAEKRGRHASAGNSGGAVGARFVRKRARGKTSRVLRRKRR